MWVAFDPSMLCQTTQGGLTSKKLCQASKRSWTCCCLGRVLFIDSVAAANLAPGDVRLAWEDGSLVRDSAAICAALQDGLARFGLTEPLSGPSATSIRTQTESLAHAQ